MYCKTCGSEINDKAVICVKCGCTSSTFNLDNKTVYILLGCVLGLFLPGIHNIYIGNRSKGLAQVLITVCSCWVLWIVCYIWTVIDVINYCERN